MTISNKTMKTMVHSVQCPYPNCTVTIERSAVFCPKHNKKHKLGGPAHKIYKQISSRDSNHQPDPALHTQMLQLLNTFIVQRWPHGTNIIMRTHKFRCYPSRIQQKMFDRWIQDAKKIYNLALSQYRDTYDNYLSVQYTPTSSNHDVRTMDTITVIGDGYSTARELFPKECDILQGSQIILATGASVTLDVPHDNTTITKSRLPRKRTKDVQASANNAEPKPVTISFKGYVPTTTSLTHTLTELLNEPTRYKTLEQLFEEYQGRSHNEDRPIHRDIARDYPITQLPNAFSQDKVIRQLRSKYPEWCNSLPAALITPILESVQQAYKMYLNNRRQYRNNPNQNKRFPKPPRFKKRNDLVVLKYKRPDGYKIQHGLKQYARIFGFPKTGKSGVCVRLHHPIRVGVDQVRGQALVRDNRRWYLTLAVETPQQTCNWNLQGTVGVDLGVNRPIQLSDGTQKDYPVTILKRLEQTRNRLKKYNNRNRIGWPKRMSQKSQRVSIRRQQLHQKRRQAFIQYYKLQHDYDVSKKPSKRYLRVQRRIANIDNKMARLRNYYSKMAAAELTRTFQVIKVEDLQIKNMTKSAKGTLESPGVNVRAKAGLNRSFLNVAPGMFIQNLKYKAQETGAQVISVNPAYTSQTCNQCKYVDSKNRISQEIFQCIKCGHRDNADVNAAKNIRDKEPTE